jgi:hypothetical protein
LCIGSRNCKSDQGPTKGCRAIIIIIIIIIMTVTVAQKSKASTVFALSEAGIVGSNPTQGMDV